MNTSDPNLIRGFGIANIVLSALAILAFALLGIFVGLLGGMMSDPAISNQIANDLYNDPQFMYEMDELYAYGYTDVDADDIVGVVLLLTGGFAIMIGIGAVLSIVSLVAGIMAVRNYRNPEKMGALFGWSIAGAVCAVICGRVISAVLLILQTVCVHKQRQIASGAAYAAPPAGSPMGQHAAYGYGYNYAPHPGAAHAGYAPQQPYGAPVAGTAPAGYAQPIPNAYPGSPAAAPAPMTHPAPAAQPIPNAAKADASPAAASDVTADKSVEAETLASTETSAASAPAKAKDSEEGANN